MRPLPILLGKQRRHREVSMGEHREGDVPIPTVVAADLVLIEPDLGFRGLEAVLDRPSGTSDPDQFLVVVPFGAPHR